MKPTTTIALYPGTFDPITNGHIDILDRASSVFDHVIVTMAMNSSKQTMLAPETRLRLIQESCAEMLPERTNIEVVRFDGLLAEFGRERGAVAIIRGLRTLGDFEYEMQMALMNRRLNSALNTFFLPADERYVHLNSTIVRELARHKADLDGLVPPPVIRVLQQRSDNI